MNHDLTAKIDESTEALTQPGATESEIWLAPYDKKRDDARHHFVVFLKPEVTARDRGIDFRGVVDLVLCTLADRNIEVGAARILRGPYLSQHRIMDQHYGVLNQISHQGRDAISEQAMEKLRAEFGSDVADGPTVMGGHGLLDAYPTISPFALALMSDNVGTTKLAGGTYALKLSIDGQTLVVLNAFHPYQLEPFYAERNAIVVLECFSDMPWAELRTNVAGTTDPATAAAGSMRNQLLQRQSELKLPNVAPGANGIHLSAGPLEGMVEVQRFFADHEKDQAVGYDETNFGRQLAAAGATPDQVASWSANAALESDGKRIPAFDLTEEIDAAASIEALLKAPVA